MAKLINKKRISALVLALVLIFAAATTAVATSSVSELPDITISIESIYEPIIGDSLVAEIGTVSVKQQLEVNGVDVDLYRTFDSNEDALSNIYAETSELLDLIQVTYGCDDFSDETWEEYQAGMFELVSSDDRPLGLNESNIQFRKLRNFFDIYENDAKNEEIVVLLEANPSLTKEVLELVPYTSINSLNQQLQVSDNSIGMSINSVVYGFDIDDGVTYATAHATSRNSAYKSFSSDCTNFVSQILEAGGVLQEVYASEYSGWWHTTSTTIFGITTHQHSVSWINANTFAGYMGVTYTTEDHAEFKSNIQKGDFIAGDWESDGDWNHMGFVTNKTSVDYRVAQHTSDYHEWASSSKNGWDEVGSDGGTYGRVRR